MRIAIMGSGGVGGYVGARLAAAGQDVTFIARGAHLKAMLERGLRLESALGDATLRPVRATDDPGAVGPVDLGQVHPALGEVLLVLLSALARDGLDQGLRPRGPARRAGREAPAGWPTPRCLDRPRAGRPPRRSERTG